MDFDDEVVELAAKIEDTRAKLESDVLTPYRDLNEETLLSNYDVEQQALIHVSGALAVATSFAAYQRLSDEPIDVQLQAKVKRVQSYISKVKEAFGRQEPGTEKLEDGSVAKVKQTAKKVMANRKSTGGDDGRKSGGVSVKKQGARVDTGVTKKLAHSAAKSKKDK